MPLYNSLSSAVLRGGTVIPATPTLPEEGTDPSLFLEQEGLSSEPCYPFPDYSGEDRSGACQSDFVSQESSEKPCSCSWRRRQIRHRQEYRPLWLSRAVVSLEWRATRSGPGRDRSRSEGCSFHGFWVVLPFWFTEILMSSGELPSSAALCQASLYMRQTEDISVIFN